MRAGAVVGLVACLALSGCATSSPKPAPRAAPTPSTPSATSSATARPTVPAIPAPAPTPATIPTAGRPATARSAAAFVTFFFTQLNVAFQSGDAHVVEQLSDPECGVCNTYVTALMKDKAAGKHIVGESFAAISAEAAPPEGTIAYVTVSGTTPRRQLVVGAKVTNLPSTGVFHRTVAVLRKSDGWVVRAIRFDS